MSEMSQSELLLSASAAVVQTATVNIQVVRIGTKQMTLSVFNQLKKKGLLLTYDGEIRFNGDLWGTVNYHNSTCPDCAHYHVIWQWGNSLYKDTVCYTRENWFSSDDIAYLNFLQKATSAFPDAQSDTHMIDWLRRVQRSNYPDISGDMRRDYSRISTVEFENADRCVAKSCLMLMKEELKQQEQYEVRRKSEFHGCWFEIESSPQLFIAV